MRINAAFPLVRSSLFVFLSLFWLSVFGQENAAQPQNESEAAFAAATAAMTVGPADITLRDQAVLKLSEGFVFVPEKEAGQVLHAWGNTVDGRLMGMVFPVEQGSWFAVVEYEDVGYIKDDDAKDWDADELLESLKTGTEEGNKDRKARGMPEIDIVGWVEAPFYDAATHRLVWSLSSKDKGAPSTEDLSINYNTYALGREGYISIDLVTDMGSIESQKPIAKSLLTSLDFNQGKRYTDFDESTDKVAEYGLAALIGGVAAKKLGLFAIIAAFAVKFAKVIGIAVVGLGAMIFRRKKKQNQNQD